MSVGKKKAKTLNMNYDRKRKQKQEQVRSIEKLDDENSFQNFSFLQESL